MLVHRARRAGAGNAAFRCAGLGTAILSVFASLAPAIAGKPGTGGGGTPPAAPEIVYLSASSQAFTSVEVRGVALSFSSSGVLSSTDSSMLKASTRRGLAGIAWSPDGKQYAWIENGSIMIASPGGSPAVLYPTRAGDLRPLDASDALAWGPDCSGSGDSVLAFLSELPAYSVEALTIKGGAVTRHEVLLPLVSTCDTNNNCTAAGGSAFAFSPAGRLLAIAGFSSTMPSGVWAIPVCEVGHNPTMILDSASLGGTSAFAPATSMDWSADGKRLALSVITGPDPDYPSRDLRIVDPGYNGSPGSETVASASVRGGNPGSSFGLASSEHSPTWDPGTTGNACERLVFSQSSDAGRSMYLLDLKSGAGCNTSLRQVAAKNPRALDWRAK